MPVSEQDELLRELGYQLAERRRALNMSLEDVYDRTRIRMEFLRGIEEGSYNGFPEPVYVRGFIRTYLHLVNSDDMLEDFEACLPGSRQKPERPAKFDTGAGTDYRPKGFKPVSHLWLFLVLFAALAGTGGYVWYVMSSGEFSLKDFVAGRDPLAAVSIDRRAEEASDDRVSFEVLPSSLDLLMISADEEPSQAPAPVKPSLEIRAVNDVWMRATSDGKTLYERTLTRGNSVAFDLEKPVRVRYGRPNSAAVTLNGKDLGPVNPRPSKGSETYVYSPDGSVRKD